MGRSELDQTAVAQVHKQVRRAIVLGQSEPGERLSPEVLSIRCGCSATPVREALKMLSQEGLVTYKPHGGFFVTRLTYKELRDLLDLRRILEVASVERAVSRLTDEQFAELNRVHAGYTGDDDESRDRYMLENKRFHCLVAQASENGALADALASLHDRLTPYMEVIHSGDEMERIHKRLIEALGSRDAARARECILNEVNETYAATLERVAQDDGDYWHVRSTVGQLSRMRLPESVIRSADHEPNS